MSLSTSTLWHHLNLSLLVFFCLKFFTMILTCLMDSYLSTRRDSWRCNQSLIGSQYRRRLTRRLESVCVCVFFLSQVREQVMARYRLATHRKTYEDMINEDIVPNIRLDYCNTYIYTCCRWIGANASYSTLNGLSLLEWDQKDLPPVMS